MLLGDSSLFIVDLLPVDFSLFVEFSSVGSNALESVLASPFVKGDLEGLTLLALIYFTFGVANVCASEFPEFIPSSFSLSILISSSYCFNKASLGSSLILGLFLMFFARDAYRSVDRVSSKL